VTVTCRRSARKQKLENENDSEEGARSKDGAPRKRKRTSLAAFCARLTGQPRCQTCGLDFAAMIDYARHMKREHRNSHRHGKAIKKAVPVIRKI
jgi:hypothetical protein